VQVEVVDMMIGTNIDGVVVDMQVASVTRNNVKGIKEREEALTTKVKQMEGIVDIEALKNG
jgi:hypothetical protein